jgi:hypothetical protein
MGVTGASAEVAIERMPDLVARWRFVPFKELHRGHHHARRAIPALQTVAFPEPFLDGVHLAIGEALDRGDFRAVTLDSKHGAGFNRLPVNEDGARAANAGLASHVRASEATRFP